MNQNGFSANYFISLVLIMVSLMIVAFLSIKNLTGPVSPPTPLPNPKITQSISTTSSPVPSSSPTIPPKQLPPVQAQIIGVQLQPRSPIPQPSNIVQPSSVSIQIESPHLLTPKTTHTPIPSHPPISVITGPPLPSVPANFYQCSQDEDCVKISTKLCGCERTAINKNYVKEWELQLNPDQQRVYCPQVMCDDDLLGTSSPLQPRCIENKCQLVNTAS